MRVTFKISSFYRLTACGSLLWSVSCHKFDAMSITNWKFLYLSQTKIGSDTLWLSWKEIFDESYFPVSCQIVYCCKLSACDSSSTELYKKWQKVYRIKCCQPGVLLIHTISILQQYVSYYVHVTCFWPDCHMEMERRWWCNRRGKLAGHRPQLKTALQHLYMWNDWIVLIRDHSISTLWNKISLVRPQNN